MARVQIALRTSAWNAGLAPSSPPTIRSTAKEPAAGPTPPLHPPPEAKAVEGTKGLRVPEESVVREQAAPATADLRPAEAVTTGPALTTMPQPDPLGADAGPKGKEVRVPLDNDAEAERPLPPPIVARARGVQLVSPRWSRTARTESLSVRDSPKTDHPAAL